MIYVTRMRVKGDKEEKRMGTGCERTDERKYLTGRGRDVGNRCQRLYVGCKNEPGNETYAAIENGDGAAETERTRESTDAHLSRNDDDRYRPWYMCTHSQLTL